MPASMIVGRGEVKAMATKQKESQTITKELAYLLSRLCTVEATTMRVRLSRLVGRCDVTAFRFLSLSLLLSPHSGSILDPWTACNINYARIRIARGEKKSAWVRVDTRYVTHFSHIHATTTKGDSPLKEMSI